MIVRGNYTNKRQGKLVFSHRVKMEKGKWYWFAKCDCGTQKAMVPAKTTSCGCERVTNSRDAKITHGSSKPRGPHFREYVVWCSMKARCMNPNNKFYSYYGGRGIDICDRWKHSFENFLADMGQRPKGLSIDRINNNGNYEPCNCRWANSKTQRLNRRDPVRVLEFNGEIKTISEWSEATGIKSLTIRYRLKRGFSVSDALTKPVKSYGRL